ncbi:MAG TPA: hypothetical protein VK445_04845 [Dissulfurispiraceae bacterium]|nr:hypothetical protein [Dissulfurispiraceae bacterium]
MEKHLATCMVSMAFMAVATGFCPADAQDSASTEVMEFVQQVTDKTKACERNGVSEQQCVCQSRAEWQDMLVLMQLMRQDPNVDSANRAVLSEGEAKVQGMLTNCK